MTRQLGVRVAAIGLAAAAIFLGASAVGAADAVGGAAQVEGEVIVIRGIEGTAESLTNDAPLYAGDIVHTFDGGRAMLRFKDDTVVTLGEGTTIEISEFVFEEARDTRSVLLTIAEGVYRATVGRLLSHSRFEVQTLATVASVRGTDWMGEATLSDTAIVSLGGVVAVRSANPDVPGEVKLYAGEGTSVRVDQPPSPAGTWSATQVSHLRDLTSLD